MASDRERMLKMLQDIQRTLVELFSWLSAHIMASYMQRISVQCRLMEEGVACVTFRIVGVYEPHA